MPIRFSWPPVLTLAIILAGCKQVPPPPAPDTYDADVKAIRGAGTACNQALAAKDLDKVAAYYADNASIFWPDMPLITGMAAIKAAFKAGMDDKNSSLSFVSDKVDVAKSGDLAYGWGTYTMKLTDPKTGKVLIEKGKYVTVYKKQADGGWRAVAEIDNEDAPPTPVKK